MLNSDNKLLKYIVENDYCIGCGACATIENSKISMRKDENGKIRPYFSENIVYDAKYEDVCPFYNNEDNEDTIGRELFSHYNNINHDSNLGYYLQLYSGYVKSENFRDLGGSGGFGNWLLSKMLKDNIATAIIHVKKSDRADTLFEYSVSNNILELKEGAKSRYYPIEMSKIINYIVSNPGKYVLVGIPCFLKAINLICKKNLIVNERVTATLGLVCGHLKSDFFAKSIGWELGIHPNNLTDIDFRVKIPGRTSTDYGITVAGNVNCKIKTISKRTKKLITSNWGHGLFKYNACDYCDDVVAELADISIGDAWIDKYMYDYRGANILIVRNPIIQNIIEKYKAELHLEKSNIDEIIKSQSAGFRHRREGLSYRIALKEQKGEWYPRKRFCHNFYLSKKREKIYELRVSLMHSSFKFFRESLNKNDFNYFKKKIKKEIWGYNKLVKPKLLLRVKSRLYFYFNKISKIVKVRKND